MSENIGQLFRELRKTLADSGNENPHYEAQLLMEAVCGVSSLDIITNPDIPVTDSQKLEAEAFASRRVSGEPLQYILGRWEFYGLPFDVGEGVLIPRQDTETLAEISLEYIKERKNPGFLAADLCAGSGCIGITAAKLGGVNVKLLELSEKAFSYLSRNITLNGVERLCTAVCADVLSDKTAEAFPQLDLIMTNPPYITAQDMQQLQKEVTYEPETALSGGEDGLDYYRIMIPLWSRKLKKGGMIAAEIGRGQDADVIRIFRECGLDTGYKKDMCGIIRVIYGINGG